MNERQHTQAHARVAWVLGIAAVIAYVAFALLHASVVNVDAARHDQSTYLSSARELKLAGFTAPTNRMQMPAYIYLQALFVDPSLDDAAAFARGKWVNIALSVFLLGALGIFFRRTLPRVEAWIMTLATAFTVFVFRAGYFQAELLFYTIAFFGFVALCRLWTSPTPLRAIVAGLLEAAAYLTKGSVPPGMVLFAALFVTREAIALRRARWEAGAWRSSAKHLCSLALLPVAFCAPMFPYLRTNMERYGAWFYNLSSTYVLWFDSWDDFLTTEKVLGNWHTWHLLPEIVKPTHSATAYLRSHSIGQIVTREALGLGEVLGNVVISHGYVEYVCLYTAFIAIALGFTRAPVRSLLTLDLRSEGAFVLPLTIMYIALFGFYAPIAAGNRFILMLFLPVLYTLMRAGITKEPTISAFGREVSWRDFNRGVLILLALHIVFVLPMTITRIYAGG